MFKKSWFSPQKIFIIFLCLLLFQPLSIIANSLGKDSSIIQSHCYSGEITIVEIQQKSTFDYADLVLILFEAWWANVNNGTLYVRYLVDNIGKTYHSPDHPIRLNISFKNSSNEIPFAFVNQSSFIDPFTWYSNETIGGCIQISLSNKPCYIEAYVNSFLDIPEKNVDNNIAIAFVYNGIVIKGRVLKHENQGLIPASQVSIKKCNESSLQSNLYIRFETNKSGYYILSLYPKKPLDQAHQYNLLFTDKESQKILLLETTFITYNTTVFHNITYLGFPPQQPRKPFGFAFGFKNQSKHFMSLINDPDNHKLWYKIKWDINSYTSWFGPLSSPSILLIRNSWTESGVYPLQIIV